MVYLALGTNLGDRESNLRHAIERMNQVGITVVRRSSLYETEPRDVTDQPWFMNMAVMCETRYSPTQLMKELLRIEKEMGRDRSTTAIRRGPRLIDLDILLYDESIIEEPELTVPHPRILERRFVLEPLVELAPLLTDPRTGRAFAEALPSVRDQKLKKLAN